MYEKLVSVENLSKHFHLKKGLFSQKPVCVRAVNNVSFSVYKGETVGLVGESGCGKSTTGKTILNLLSPSSGRVCFEDRTIFDVEGKQFISKSEMLKLRRKMQIIFQDPYACLDPRKTIGDIVGEGLRLDPSLSPTKRMDIVRNILEKCGLGEDCLLKYPHQFSGGQRQRIGIARALSVNPQFVVCDEPTAALDVSIQSQILNLMIHLKKEFQLSYLFISHDLTIVENFCDRICVMYLGFIVEEAQSKELFADPRHPYTKALLAAVPRFGKAFSADENILEGEIPSPSNIPCGCPFHTRCPHSTDICKETNPPLTAVNENHKVACHLSFQKIP